jgi:iron complex transport system substrate-binding protein
LHWYDQKLRQIKEVSKHSSSAPRVYLEGFSKYQTLGPGSGGYELSTFIGASNIASVFPTSFARITPEWVLSQNPDIIVKVVSLKDSYSYDNHQKFQNIQLEIMQRPGWNFIRAVRQGKVYVLASDIAAGPRAVVGAAYLTKWFFPESNLKPQDMHSEYFEEFLKQQYSGLYAYPE